MTRQEARNIVCTDGACHTLVVYFTKRDGTPRRMVCRYGGARSLKPHLITVWDIEKGATRNINLDTTARIVVLRGRRDRPAAESGQARRGTTRRDH